MSALVKTNFNIYHGQLLARKFAKLNGSSESEEVSENNQNPVTK